MNKYELLYIVPAQYTDEEVTGVQKTVAQILEKSGAVISRDELLGKIKLAYPIKKVRHGTYVLVQFQAEAEAMSEMDRTLRLSDEVLRHLITHMPPGAEAKVYELTEYVAPLSEEARAQKSERKAPAKEEETPVVKAEASKEEKPKLSMEELDQKLDKILEEDITKDA